MQFLGKFGKIVCWRPPWRVGAPTSGKSGIRHWSGLGKFISNILLLRASNYAHTQDQWRIQDFPEGGVPTHKSAIIFQIFLPKTT